MIATLDALLSGLAAVLLGLLMVPLVMTVWRMVAGPGYANRFIALDMLSGIAVAAGGLTAAATGRREFLDVAFGLALVGFVATCAFAALLEGKGEDD